MKDLLIDVTDINNIKSELKCNSVKTRFQILFEYFEYVMLVLFHGDKSI